MRFLLDQSLSARLAMLLAGAGHDAVHVADLGLSRADDRTILDRAAEEGRVLISAGALLARAHRRRPSLILFRRERPRRAPAQATCCSAISTVSLLISAAARSGHRRGSRAHPARPKIPDE